MSIRVMSMVWEHSKQEGGALLLMLDIADHADDSGMAFPGIERLARKARLTERQIYRLLQQLIRSGEISIEHGGGRHRANVYRINMALGKGDEMSGVTKCQGLNDGNPDIHVTETLTPASQNPDAHVTPTVIEPSVNHHSLDADAFVRARGVKKQTGTKKQANPRTWPSDLVLTEKMRADALRVAKEIGIALNPEAAFEVWHDLCLAKGYRYVDWPAAWRNHIRLKPKYDSPPAFNNGSRPAPLPVRTLPTPAEVEAARAARREI
jgi:hypothetical protein